MEYDMNKPRKSVESDTLQDEDEFPGKMLPLSSENIEALSFEEIRQVLLELRVHQIELEMQNEELRSKQEELDAARAHHFDFYDLAPVGYCTISVQGLILAANLTIATLLDMMRGALINQPFTRFIHKEDQDIYYLHRKQLFDTGEPQNCELRMLKMDGSAFWSHLAATAAQDADGTPVCRIVMSDITERRQSDEKLRESELNFRTLADSGQAMVWTSGTDRRCNYFNRVWLEFTGRTLEQEEGNGWAEGVHPDDLQRCLDIYVGAFDRREKFSIEYRLRRYDGEYRWILDEGCPRYDRNNEFAGYIGHCLDITRRKQEEDKLHEQKMKFRRLFENIREVYFETTLAGVFLEISPSVLDVFGFSREEVIGKSVTDFYVNSVDRSLYLEMLLKNGTVTNYETQFIYKDGTHHWISITSTLVYQSDGTSSGIIGSIRDVTDRKQKEMELQVKGSAISTSIYGIAFVKLDGTIVYVNSSFIDMWGYDAEKDMIDRPLNDLFKTDPPVFNIAGYLLEKGNNGAEMTAVRNNHSLFAAQVSAGLIRDVTGNPLCINISVADISVRKEMEDTMIRQEKMSSLGLLSAGLAHELRNPLAVISSCAQFSLENLSTDRLVTENFQVIYRNSQKASNLINDLLAFSRPSDMEQKMLNINDIFLKMTDMARLEMTACRIIFENQLAPDLPLVCGDEEKLGQVFLNIMINAIQAVGGKGIIIIKTAFHPNRRQVEAAVIDNGPGIPEEYRKRIFDPFFTTKDGGTGLGLSISFSIIQLHNGIILAEPNAGGGTRISVILPATFQTDNGKETNHAD